MSREGSICCIIMTVAPSHLVQWRPPLLTLPTPRLIVTSKPIPPPLYLFLHNQRFQMTSSISLLIKCAKWVYSSEDKTYVCIQIVFFLSIIPFIPFIKFIIINAIQLGSTPSCCSMPFLYLIELILEIFVVFLIFFHQKMLFFKDLLLFLLLFKEELLLLHQSCMSLFILLLL